MLKHKQNCFLIALCIVVFVGSVIAQDVLQIQTLRISVIIPCYHKHAIHLYPLLRLLESQTVLPDEIVISLSEIDKVGDSVIKKLTQEEWAFPVKLIYSKQRFFAGHNRNIACRYASGDILMSQDADDLPHPRRVEIVKHFFQKHDLDFLMHKFVIRKHDEPINMPGIGHVVHMRHRNPITFDEAVGIGNVTNGNIVVSRHVFEKCSWPCSGREEDLRFNRLLFEQFKKRLVLEVPLLIYREYLSSCEGKRERDIRFKDVVLPETKRAKTFSINMILYGARLIFH